MADPQRVCYFFLLHTMKTSVWQYKPGWPSSLHFITSEAPADPSRGIWVECYFLSWLPQHSDRLHVLMPPAAQRTQSATSLPFTSRAVCPCARKNPQTWHEWINCSEIGHDDKLFSSVRRQRYKFLFLLPVALAREKRYCFQFYDKAFYSPLTLTEQVIRRGFQVEWSTSVNRQVCR